MKTWSRKYVPRQLSRTDLQQQIHMLETSRKMYRSTNKKFSTRKTLKSFTSRPSSHIKNAQRMYDVDAVRPSAELAQKTGCSLSALQQIVRKGQGAYFSSGSRPNQTPQSWGHARLASAITGQKASIVDYDILKQGCHRRSRALHAAQTGARDNNPAAKTMSGRRIGQKA
jgi:hypothetical protein